MFTVANDKHRVPHRASRWSHDAPPVGPSSVELGAAALGLTVSALVAEAEAEEEEAEAAPTRLGRGAA